MEKLILTLRQRKLLHYVMIRREMITGKELARELGVTDRTIRTDVAEINRVITPFHARILSERSKGYQFTAEDDEKIHELNRIELGLLSKEDRARYLAFLLCLSDHPVHLYDLEEEMFASRTTLEQDLKVLQQKFVYANPYIRLYQKNNELSFEQNEEKIRIILTRLVHDDWSYHKEGNAYYGYHFLEEKNVTYIMDTVPVYLHKYGIFLEDPALVYLDLMIAVAYLRLRDGHVLPDNKEIREEDPKIRSAVDEIFRELDEKFQEDPFPESERKAVYAQIASTRLPENIEYLESASVFETLDLRARGITDLYLEKIRSVFGIDLTGDHDFYVTLCIAISNFQNDSYIYNSQGNHTFAKERMQDELEIAVLFQEISREYLGRLLTEIELINLAHCISGALIYLFQTHPEFKLRTVICTHRNMMSLWHLKRVLLSQYNTYLEITGLIPVNSRTSYDFSNTDLVLTTVNREITDYPGTETLPISYFITAEDSVRISDYIKRKRFERLCPVLSRKPSDLLKEAFWHEKEHCKSLTEIIRILSGDFREESFADGKLSEDILQREAITSFVTGRSIAFVHSLLPAEQTKLSVMTLEHRVVWNGHRVRIIILGVFRPEDAPMLFPLKRFFYEQDREAMRFLKTKEEVCGFFGEREE